MPDRNAELLAADRAARLQAYEAGIAEYHDQHPEAGAHLTRAAIANCRLCDDDGYRGLQACDHVDRTAAAARGSALVRAQLPPRKDQR
ncbi:hypothetical protein [Mycolicibacterium fluoranthenivorans]|uniref:Uncharacterized protein n=1 Tax=Mycolicibacterium fluoranthenivorans TaxID=258505 RepID=A0A7X5ZFF3_9MYCO|nr:hypothetical protein [Mycolicibacterium fluoranthenivorans]MCV7358506.1 hypothetical protein [Mycolicibacterium fluoranthenivorans]NIH98083.1 hypothetical protein [Mycolicibacterium fluoranthenivorans]